MGESFELYNKEGTLVLTIEDAMIMRVQQGKLRSKDGKRKQPVIVSGNTVDGEPIDTTGSDERSE